MKAKITQRKRSPKNFYQFDRMKKIGDNYWFNTYTQNLITNFRNWCERAGKKWECKVRTETIRGVTGARITRIK